MFYGTAATGTGHFVPKGYFEESFYKLDLAVVSQVLDIIKDCFWFAGIKELFQCCTLMVLCPDRTLSTFHKEVLQRQMFLAPVAKRSGFSLHEV